MADVNIAIRGTPVTAKGLTATVSAASNAATAVGDYILVVASVDFKSSAADLTIAAATGVSAWTQVASSADGTTEITRAWLGKVTTAGARTAVVSQNAATSGLHVHLYTLDANGGTITADGNSAIQDRATPYAHTSFTMAGSKNLLIVAQGGVQFSGTLTFGAAPSGMTVGAANYQNAESGLQSCYQIYTSTGVNTGKSQTSNIATLDGGAGIMVALRSQSTTTTVQAVADADGLGALTAAARQGRAVSRDFPGAGAMSATAGQGRAVAADTSASGVLTSAATQVRDAALEPLSATGSFAALAVRVRQAQVSLTGVSSTNLSLSPSGAADLSGSTALTAAASQDQRVAGSLSAAGELDADASQDQVVTTGMSALGALLADGRREQPAVASLGALGTATFDGRRVHPIATTLHGVGVLGAAPTLVHAVRVNMGAFGTFQARPASEVGGALNVSAYAIHPDTGRLVPLPEFSALTVSPILNEPGAMEIQYPKDGKNFDLLRSNITEDRDIEVEVWLSGRQSSALRFILMESSGDDVGEGAVWSFSGPSLNYLLSEIRVYPQPGNEKLELVLSHATAGEVIRTVVEQAQDRGALEGMTLGFSDSVDSNGLPWVNNITTTFSPGTTGKAVLDSLVSLGMVEWEVTTDRVLKAYAPGSFGIDRTLGTDPVVLRRGRQVPDAPRKHTVRESPTSMLAAGSEGVYEVANDPEAVSRRGRRIEGFASANNLSDSAAVYGFAQTALNASSPGVMELTQGVEFTPGDPRPGAAYDIGDWVYADTQNRVERLRIKQWSLSVDKDGASGTVSLNDLITERSVTLARRLEALSNGTATVGTSSGEDTGIPVAPTGVVVGSDAYMGSAGEALATVQVGWDAVTLNTDGNVATDISGYNVQYKYNSGIIQSGWTFAGSTDQTQLTFGGVSAGETIDVQVQTVDRSNNVSEWSAIEQHSVAVSSTPPAIPSTPVVDNYLGVIRITWDGLTSTGAEMSIGFDYVEVHVSTSAAFLPTPDTLFMTLNATGTAVYMNGAYGVTYYARLVAVNTSKLSSAPSGIASAIPERVVGTDVFDGAIGTAKLADAAITTAKINDLAVNDAKIGSLNVGKLTTGNFVASMTMSGLIQTAPSGQRMVIDNSGWTAYNSSGVVFAKLNIPANTILVTGTYQSALSGERINILVDGTLRFYPSVGTNYSRIANEGNDVVWRGPLDGNQRSGRVNVNTTGVGINFSAETELTSLRSEVAVQDRMARVTAPVVIIRVDGRFSPPSGNRRFTFVQTNSSGVDVGASVLNYYGRTLDGLATLSGGGGSGFVFDAGAIAVVSGSDTSPGNITAADFAVVSTETLKENVADARTVLDPVTTIKQARSKSWNYVFDRWFTPPATPEDPDPEPVEVDPPTRFGPIAEDLPQVLRTELPNPDGSGTVQGVSLGSQIGVMWGALGQIFDQEIRVVTGAVTLSDSRIWSAGKSYDIPITWDSTPLEVPKGAIPSMDVGIAWQGKVTATAIQESITLTGCTVRVKNVSNSVVVPIAGQPITVHATGLYLWTPPFS